MIDVFIRLVSLPFGVEGVTVPNDDQTYNVYLNADICERKRQAALRHELQHIKKNHLYDNRSIRVVEAEAG